MQILRITTMIALALALSIALSACGQPAAAPTSTIAPAAISTPTRAAVASPIAASSPPAVARATAAPTTAPAASPAAGGPSPSELASRARAADQYSFNAKVTTGGQTINAKGYVKGTKMRQETSVGGIDTVMLLDSQTKVAYMLLPGQNSAVKMDVSKAQEQATSPSEEVNSLPSDARFVGSETVDGKPASVYESTSGETKTKYWMWTERGLPLKLESTSPQGTAVVEFTNYQFGPQPDNLFELPAGTQVIDAPAGIPGGPGGLPVPKQ